MNRTKDAIIEAFWQLLDERPYSKITVKDIVDRCHINRNTFYYHFHDIPELLEISVRTETDYIIQKYSRFGSPLDCLEPLVELSMKRRRALLHIYRSIQREVFLNQFERIAIHSVSRYIDTVAEDLILSEDDRNLLIRFYKCIFVGVVLDWLDSGMSYDLVSRAQRLSELFGNPGNSALLLAAKGAPDSPALA
ncbi:MAG: TetR/AcrR family transcriptional regulator [Firmicutes bacterium]|nr:TetR/AcrR family transcriptional regulator [Bacillota bacterium]MDD7602178.1 TetR/AcrR family transcriptional regulator [Bacillota bacterium]MDY5857353.1 TetR/AcrR family transcriptional regulator [Anaerovoracaceae bacterium]